jgi:hypothetical protein
MAAIDLQNIRINISDLTQTRDQLQQTVDGLGEEMMNRSNENKRLEEFAYRFKMSNENYLKIKDVAKEHLTNLLTNAEPDKKALLQIALNSIVLALNASPYRYDIIFNSNSSNSSNEYKESLLVLANSFFNQLLEKSVNRTMATLEAGGGGGEKEKKQ